MLTNLARHCPFGQCCQFGQFVRTVWTGQVTGDYKYQLPHEEREIRSQWCKLQLKVLVKF